MQPLFTASSFLNVNVVRAIGLTLATLLIAPGAQAKAGPVVTVNGKALPSAAFDDALIDAKRRFRRAGRPFTNDARMAVKRIVARKLIAQQLLNDAIKKYRMNISAADIEKARAVEEARFRTKKGYEAYLRANAERDDDTNARLTQSAQIQKLAKKLLNESPPTRADAKNELAKNQDNYSIPSQQRLRQIVLSYPKRARPAARDEIVRRAAGIAHKARRSPKKFPELAKQYSEGPTAAQGGTLGLVKQGRFPIEIDEALAGAEVGDIVGPVETEHGVHIFIVEELRAEHRAKLGPWELVVYNELTTKWEHEVTAKLYAKLFSDAKVVFHDPEAKLDAAQFASDSRGRRNRGRRKQAAQRR